jgi:hypothetical protein
MDTPKNSCRWALILEGRELLRIYRELGVSKVERSNNVRELISSDMM